MSDWTGSSLPNVDARLEGSEVMSAVGNTSTEFYINFNFDCDMTGIEFYAWSPNKGDTLNFYTEYNAGPYGWKRYKKFGKNFNVFPNHISRIILFPTSPKAGSRIKVVYNNTGNSAVDFSINRFQFTAIEKIDPTKLQEGEDW